MKLGFCVAAWSLVVAVVGDSRDSHLRDTVTRDMSPQPHYHISHRGGTFLAFYILDLDSDDLCNTYCGLYTCGWLLL